jgi:hypothetical protein
MVSLCSVERQYAQDTRSRNATSHLHFNSPLARTTSSTTMKFRSRNTRLALIITLAPLIKAQDYAATCWDVALGNCEEVAWFLSATCSTGNGVAFETSLNLNECLANINSNWALQANGNFGWSAGQCYLDGTVLHCNPIPYGIDLVRSYVRYF